MPKTTSLQNNDAQLIRDAEALVAHAKLRGSAILPVPRWMLEQLIEKATRPHD